MSDIPQVQNTLKPKNHQEAQKHQVQNAVVKYYTSIPSLVKDQKDCKISPMAKRIIAEKISGVGNKMGGNFVHNLSNIKGNMDFQDLVKKNWDLKEFCAICLMELDKQEKLFEKRAGNNQASKTKCKDVCDQTRIEIGEMITREIEVNTKWRNIPGNEKKTLEISGRDLLKSVGDQKKKTADKIQIAANTTLFIFGVSNVVSGGALALPTAVIPLLRFVGISLFDIHKINIEQLQKQKYKFAESLENKLGSLWSEIENGNLSKKDAKVLEGKLQPFFGLVENRTNLIKILAEIQNCKQNDTEITTDNLKKEDSIFVNICKLSTPTYWNSLKTNLDSKNLSNGWKSKLAWNLAQVVGFGLGEIGVGSYFAHRNPFNYIGKGMQDGWKNVVSNFIPNHGTAQGVITSNLGLVDLPKEVSPVLSISPTPLPSPTAAYNPEPIIGGVKNAVQTQNIIPENLFQKSLNTLNNFFPGINTNVPANSYLARMIEETLNNSDKIPQGISPAHWTLQNWATGNKVTSEAFRSILNNPEFTNLNGVRDLAHLNPNQIEILKNSLPLAQQKDFNLAFFDNKKFAEITTRTYSGVVETMKNSAVFGALATSAAVLIANFWKPKEEEKKLRLIKNTTLGAGVIGIGMAGAVPVAVGTGAILGGKALYNKLNNKQLESRGSKENGLMNETEVILTEIKPRISSIVDKNRTIESPEMFEKILAKVLAQKVYTSGTNEEIKEDLEISLNILANFENEKNNIPENHLGFYKKLATIIKEVLAENSVSTRNIRPPTEIDCGISKQELQDLEIQHLQIEITGLLTNPEPKLDDQTLQQKIATIISKDGSYSGLDIDLLKKMADNFDLEFLVFVDRLKSLRNLGVNNNLSKTLDGLKELSEFCTLLITAFDEVGGETVVQNRVEVETGTGIDPKEQELEPKPEKELTKSEAEDLEAEKIEELKNKLLELRNTKIGNFLYKDILGSLQATSLTPLLEKLGFGSYDEYKNFAREIIKQTGKDFNDLLRFIFLSIDENSNSRTLTQLSKFQEKRTSQQLQTQIEITQKAIELIQEKVKELQTE